MKPCYDNKVMSSVWWSTIKYSQKTLGSSFVAYYIQVTAFVHVEVIFVACFTSTRRFFFNEIVTQRIFFLRVMLRAELEQPRRRTRRR